MDDFYFLLLLKRWSRYLKEIPCLNKVTLPYLYLPHTWIRKLMITCNFKAHSTTIPSQNSDTAKGIRIYFWTANYSGRLQILLWRNIKLSNSKLRTICNSIESVLTVGGQRVEKMSLPHKRSEWCIRSESVVFFNDLWRESLHLEQMS